MKTLLLATEKQQPNQVSNVNWLVWFYGLSTLEGYLMPNSAYTYIKCDLKINSL